MSGIRTGTRLEQLVDLQRTTMVQHEHARCRLLPTEHDLARLLGRIAVEIAAEHRKQKARPELVAAVRAADTDQIDRLAHLGVTAHDVKAWAVDHGLLPPPIKRGRVANHLIDAYVAAHTQEHA